MAELNIESYKASGIYFIEMFGNENYTFPLVSGRLLIGSSKTGLINAAISVSNPHDAVKIYGENDIYLESKGSYFHQTLKTALLEGPVYALNVLPVDLMNDNYDGNNYKNKDRSGFTIFNLEPAISTGGSVFSDIEKERVYYKDAPIKDMFNRQRFWSASDDKLIDTKNNVFNNAIASTSLLNIANLSKKDVTVFILKANVIGYDLTIEEWYKMRYKNPTIPTFLNSDDLVSDYFVDVIVVSGNWTNYEQLSKDSVFGNYFTKNGLITEKINNFLQAGSVNVVSRTTGSLIPEFVDVTGNNISIDRLFNNLYPMTEMILAIDKEKMNGIDLSEDEFNSSASAYKTYRIDTVGHGLFEKDNNTTTPDYNTIDNDENIAIDMLSYQYTTKNKFKYNIETITDWDDAVLGHVYFKGNDYSEIRAYEDSKLYKLWKKGLLNNGIEILNDSYATPTTNTYLKVVGEYTTSGGTPIKYIVLKAYLDITLLTVSTFDVSNPNFATNKSLFLYDKNMSNISTVITTANDMIYNDGILEINEIDITSSISDFNEYIKSENYILTTTNEGRRRLMKIISVNSKKVYPDVSAPSNVAATAANGGTIADDTYYYSVAAFDGKYWSHISTEVEIDVSESDQGKVTLNWSAVTGAIKYRIYRGTTSGTYDHYIDVLTNTLVDSGSNLLTFSGIVPEPPYKVYYIKLLASNNTSITTLNLDVNNTGSNTSILVQKPIYEHVPTINGKLIPKFTIREQLLPNGTAQRQQEIIQFVLDSGLANAISDTESIDIKYIIDTYKGEITPSSKFNWGLLAAKHGKALVFTNDPSMTQFESHTDPSFIESDSGLINVDYIVKGGNQSLNPSYSYSLPNYTYNGVPIGSYMYFIGPEILIRRNSKITSTVPSIYASNVYLRRSKSGDKFGIPAAKRGIISESDVVGVEYSFNDTERGLLETNGHNVIIRKRRIGTMIFTDNTAYYKVKSPLNSATNRDILITIEKGIDLILFNYLYSYNDSLVQIRVTTALEHYLNGIVSAGGLEFATVTFNDSNNTPEIKRNHIGLIDIVIGFKDGIHKFINKINFNSTDNGVEALPSGFLLF